MSYNSTFENSINNDLNNENITNIQKKSKNIMNTIENSSVDLIEYDDFFSSDAQNKINLIKNNNYFLINREWLVQFKKFCNAGESFPFFTHPGKINNNDLIIEDNSVLKLKNEPKFFNNKYDIDKVCVFIKKDLWEQLLELFKGGPQYEIIYNKDKNNINIIKKGGHINLLFIPEKKTIMKKNNNFIINKYIYYDLDGKVIDLINYINKILNHNKKIFSIQKKEKLEDNKHYRVWLYSSFELQSDELCDYLTNQIINVYSTKKEQNSSQNNEIDWSRFSQNSSSKIYYKMNLLSNFQDEKIIDIFPNKETNNFNWKEYTKCRKADGHCLPEFSLIIEEAPFQIKNEEKKYKIGTCKWCDCKEVVYYACECNNLFYCRDDCQRRDGNSHKFKCKNYLINFFKKENNNFSVNKDLKYSIKGLLNLGNSCYMNSALQCMRSIKELTNYFLNYFDESQLNINNIIGTGGFLTLAYVNFIYNLNNCEKDYYDPELFKNTIGIIDERYSGYDQQDTHEFMTFLIDSMHEDLNRVINKPFIKRKDSEFFNYFSKEFEEKKSIVEWNNFLKRNQSIMVDLFYGQYKTTISCTYCNHKSINFSTYLSIQLPIPKYKEYFLIKIIFTEYRPDTIPYVKMNIIMNKQNKKILDAKKIIGKIFGISEQKIEIVKNKSNEIIKLYEDNEEIEENINYLKAIKINSNIFEEKINYQKEIDYTNLKEILKNKEKELIKIFKNNGNDIINNKDKEKDKNIENSNNLKKHQNYEKFIFKHYYLLNKKLSIEVIDRDFLNYFEISKSCFDIYYKVYEIFYEIIIKNYLNFNINEKTNNNEGIKRKTFDDLFKNIIDKDIEYSNDIFEKYEYLPFVLKYVNISNRKNKFIPLSRKCIFKDILELNNSNNNNNNNNIIIINNKDNSNDGKKNVIELNQKQNNDKVINNNNNCNIITNENLNVIFQDGNDSDKIGSMDMPTIQYNNNINKDKNGDIVGNINNINNNNKSKTENTKDSNMNNISISINITKDKEDKNEESKNNLKKIFIIWNTKYLKKSELNNSYYLTTRSSSENLDLFSFFQKIYENYFEKIDLDKCFEEFSREEIFDNDNLWKCSKCNQNIAAKNKIEIYQIPKILIIQLKRFENNQKIENIVEFPIKNLDISKFVSPSKSKNVKIPKKYDLFAVANHYGRLEYGHYDAFCLDYINNKWYDFNDRHVSEIKEEDIKNTIVTKNAYVLFYRQQNNDLIVWDKLYKKQFYDIHDNNMKNYEEDFIYKKTKKTDNESNKEMDINYQHENNSLNLDMEENEETHSLDDLSLNSFVYNPFKESYLKLKRRRNKK